MSLPVVAIIGRVNVGKSTLYNRLVRRRDAVVAPEPGITRDRLYGTARHEGRAFSVIDTGGLESVDQDPFSAQVRDQAEVALEEADAVIFLVDAQDGPVGPDREIAEVVRRSGKPYVLAANKAESPNVSVEDFFALRLGPAMPISAIHGTGIPDMLDALLAVLPEAEPEAEDERIRVAVVGRPNVGKSALVNAFVGQERMIVSELPGTTRDAVDIPLDTPKERFLLVDTAGLRRKARVTRKLEYFSVLRALRAIQRAEVVLLVLDASEGVTEQDAKIGGFAHEAGRAVVIVANKWDIVERTGALPGENPRAAVRAGKKASAKRVARVMMQDFARLVRARLPFLDYAEIVFASATEGTGVPAILEQAALVAQQYAMRVPTAELNRWLLATTTDHPPPPRKGRALRLYYGTQVGVQPPTIVLFANDPKLCHFSYERFLVNSLRKTFGFQGVPIRLLIRERTREPREAKAGSHSRPQRSHSR
jgi:GTP-binding protein